MLAAYQSLSQGLGEKKLDKKSFFSQRKELFFKSIIYTCLLIAAVTLLCIKFWEPDVSLDTSECQNLSFRREWRSLDDMEKSEYIQAVQCLIDKPSKLNLKHSRYEDLVWVHAIALEDCKLALKFPHHGLILSSKRITIT